MRKGDLVVCFNKNINFESVGSIWAALSSGNFIVYTFKNAVFGVWEKTHIKFLTNSENMLVDKTEDKNDED
tara:strand:+ start:1563 stop:1775 length:213 start_codon:yes stop_codon:yes gene_type:complete